MMEKAPIGESTLRATLNGRYIPGKYLERAVRAVMAENPVPHTQPAKAASG